MLEFIIGNWGSLLVLAIVAMVFGFIVAKMIIDKKRGKSHCACGCDSCPSAGICHTKKEA